MCLASSLYGYLCLASQSASVGVSFGPKYFIDGRRCWCFLALLLCECVLHVERATRRGGHQRPKTDDKPRPATILLTDGRRLALHHQPVICLVFGDWRSRQRQWLWIMSGIEIERLICRLIRPLFRRFQVSRNGLCRNLRSVRWQRRRHHTHIINGSFCLPWESQLQTEEPTMMIIRVMVMMMMMITRTQLRSVGCIAMWWSSGGRWKALREIASQPASNLMRRLFSPLGQRRPRRWRKRWRWWIGYCLLAADPFSEWNRNSNGYRIDV